MELLFLTPMHHFQINCILLNMRIVNLLLVCGFLFIVDSAMAQFRHFPHGQRMVFSSWSNLDTDKAFYDSTDLKIGPDSLIYTQLRPYTSANNSCLDNLSNNYGALSWIRFYADSFGLMINPDNDTHVVIPHTMQVGDTFRWNNRQGVTLNRFDKYQNGNFQDSAWFFYLISRNFFLEDSMILGKNTGWIRGSYDLDFTQIGYYEGDSLIGRNTLDWKIFFPEEAGDWKRYWYYYEHWNSMFYGQQVLDSFIAVTRYTDSIRIRKKQWIADANGIWSAARIIDTLIYPEVFINYFSDRYFGDRFMVMNQTDPDSKAIIQTNVGKEDVHATSHLFTIMYPDYRFFSTDTCNFTDQGYNGISLYKETIGVEREFYQQQGFTLMLTGGHVGDSLFGSSFLSLPFQNEEGVSVYPNPAKNELHIHTSNPLFECEVYTLSGVRIPAPLQNGTIDIRSLHSGAYILLIRQDGNSYRKLFLKE